ERSATQQIADAVCSRQPVKAPALTGLASSLLLKQAARAANVAGHITRTVSWKPVPRLGGGRALAALLASSVLVAIALAVAVILVLLIAFGTMPAGCGFDASDACTDPDANEVQALVLTGVTLLAIASAATGLVTAIVYAVLGRAGEVLRGRIVVALSGALVAVLGAGPVFLVVAPGAARPALAAATVLSWAAWPVALIKAQRAALGARS
ncbi:MAG TPA: hypothetical protein VE777_07170, partial [Gaiellales bacterium]|nr:hypothetical protein [Gaiellales bacterium]